MRFKFIKSTFVLGIFFLSSQSFSHVDYEENKKKKIIVLASTFFVVF